VQEVDASYPASDPGAARTDEDMLKAYFSTVQMPEGSTAEQAVAYLKTMLPDAGLFGVQDATFVSAHAVNVLCFENARIDMTRKGLTLVTGFKASKDGASNGAGKSGLVGLPFLGVTGRTFKEQEHDEWACRFNKLPAVLDTTLKLADGRQLDIRRQRRPSKLLVTLDGRDVTMATPAATQKLIEQLTNLTWDVITNAVYIGQHEAASVFGTDKERKELFSRLLGLNRFLDAQAKLRRVSTRLGNAVVTIEAEAQSAEAALAEASRGRQQLVDNLKSTPKPDASEFARLTKEITSLNKCIRDNEAIAVKFADEREKLTQKMRQRENESSVARGEHNALRRQLGESEQVKGTCRTCGGVVSRTSLAAYQIKLKRGMSELDMKIKDADGLARMERDRRVRTDEDIRLCASEGARLRGMLNAASVRLGELELHASVRDGIKSALAEKDARMARWRRLLSIHVGARTATLMERAFVDACVSATGRDGLPAFLCAAAVPRLNAAAAVYCEAFESDVAVVFRAASDGVEVDIVNEDGGGSYKDQSKGESSAAGIITALAFREALVPLGVLILDEPGEGLDAQSAAAFARGMNRVAERFGAAYVISHNPIITGTLEPDHHIEVVKTGKVSVVREVV
jgi:DNA repair exonuclease SbcCD ATPase subunit